MSTKDMPKPKGTLHHVHKALKHHFIPHAKNHYHPHALHTKRLVAYGTFLGAVKIFVIGCAMMLPFQAYMAPEVISAQTKILIAKTNALRSHKGLTTLAITPKLEQSAYLKAQDMAQNGYFSHTAPSGRGLSYFLGRAGYSYSTAGENLAEGFNDAESLMTAWEQSPTHLANLVDTDFTQFGIGMMDGTYQGNETIFVAQHFGTPLAIDEPKPEPTKSIAMAPAPKPKPLVITTTTTTTRAPITAPVHATTTASTSTTATSTPTIATAQPSSVQTAPPSPPTITQPAPKNPFVAPRPQTAIPDQHPIHAPTSNDNPWATYQRANEWFSVVPSVFSAAHLIFSAFFLFFVAVLGVSLAWDLHKHKPHVVIKTVGLIAFIFALWKT